MGVVLGVWFNDSTFGIAVQNNGHVMRTFGSGHTNCRPAHEDHLATVIHGNLYQSMYETVVQSATLRL